MTQQPAIAIREVAECAATWNPLRSPASDSFEYIDLGSVDQNGKQIRQTTLTRCSEAPSRARQLVKSADVLVATVRPNLNGVALVPDSLDGATASTGFCVLRPQPEKLDNRYLFNWVKSPAFITDMVRKATGASYPAVSDKIVLDSLIPLPSLSEQRRIADILDKADILRAKRRAALAELDTLTQSIFNDLFTSGLDGPAVDLSEARSGLPAGWTWELLTDAARLATGHTPDRECDDYWNGDIPWISLTDIRGLDTAVASRTIQNVTQKGIDNSSSVRLPTGTVCFSRTASVGFVTVMGREMATSQDFVNWVCGPRLDPTYLMWALIGARRRLKALSSGSTHKTIYMRVVEQFRVLVPPVSLQRDFARRITAVETLKSHHRTALANLDTLFASLQHRAFCGEL